MINKKDLLVLWLFILIAIQNPCISQSISLQSDSSLHGKYINSISASNLSKHILTLASNSFGGRKMGQSGIDSAANYLEYEYNRLGLQQVVNDYKQEFTIFDWQYSIQTLTSDQFQIEVFPTWNGALMDSAELVFVGDGYEKDYAGISVEDKMVAYYHRETSMLDPSESQPVIALRHDAKYRLCIHADSESFKSQMEKSQAFDPRAKLTDVSDKTRKAILFNVTEEDFRKLYNVEENIFLDQYHEEGKLSKGQRKQIIKQVYLNLDYHTKPITTSNIVGVIEGSDLKEEAIVISAHYD
ncbi:MAG: hypothetical protein CMB89_08610, partial [Flammeovirgaceae bacterium]|nr:hypothetical protein [Flammeovirgaceae bacterium]